MGHATARPNLPSRDPRSWPLCHRGRHEEQKKRWAAAERREFKVRNLIWLIFLSWIDHYVRFLIVRSSNRSLTHSITHKEKASPVATSTRTTNLAALGMRNNDAPPPPPLEAMTAQENRPSEPAQLLSACLTCWAV